MIYVVATAVISAVVASVLWLKPWIDDHADGSR